MRLTKVTIHNFKSISHLSLHPLSFTAITGLNGTGKSNIIDAITFITSFSNKEMRVSKLSELVRNGENECWVELTFIMKYDLYQKIMNFKGKAQTQKQKGPNAYGNKENDQSLDTLNGIHVSDRPFNNEKMDKVSSSGKDHGKNSTDNKDSSNNMEILRNAFTDSSQNVTFTVKKEIIGTVTRTYLNNNLITQSRLGVLLSHFQLLIVRQGTITKMVNNGLAVLLYESIGADPELLRNKMETLEKKEKKLTQLKNEKLRMIRPYFDEMQRIKVQMRENLLNEKMIKKLNEEILLLKYVLEQYNKQKHLIISKEILDLDKIIKENDQTAEQLKQATQLKLKVLECKEELKAFKIIKHTCPRCSGYDLGFLKQVNETAQDGSKVKNSEKVLESKSSTNRNNLMNDEENKNFSLESLPFYSGFGKILGQSESADKKDSVIQGNYSDFSYEMSNFVKDLKGAIDCLKCQSYFMKNFISCLDKQIFDINCFINELEVNIQLKEEKRTKLQLDEQRNSLMEEIRTIFKKIYQIELVIEGNESDKSQIDEENFHREMEILSESRRLIEKGRRVDHLEEISRMPQNVDLFFTYGRVYENYTVENRYETAIDALLLNKRNHIITETSHGAATGYGTFIPLDKIRPPDNSNNKGFHHDEDSSAINFIQFDQRMLPAFENMLKYFYIVDPEMQQNSSSKDIQKVIVLHKQAKRLCVLLDGTVIDFRGVMTGGKIVIRKDQSKSELVQQIEKILETTNRNIKIICQNSGKPRFFASLLKCQNILEQLLRISRSFDITIKNPQKVEEDFCKTIRNSLPELPQIVKSLNEKIRTFNEKQKTNLELKARLQSLLAKHDVISQSIEPSTAGKSNNIKITKTLQDKTAPQLRKNLINQKSRLFYAKDGKIQMETNLHDNEKLIDQTKELLQKRDRLQNFITENEKATELPETINYEKRKEIKRKILQLESEIKGENTVSKDSSDHTRSLSSENTSFRSKDFLSYFFEKFDDTAIKTYEKLKDEFRPLILDIIETVNFLSNNQNLADLDETKQKARKSHLNDTNFAIPDHLKKHLDDENRLNAHGSSNSIKAPHFLKTRRVTLLPPDTLLRESITNRKDKISAIEASMMPLTHKEHSQPATKGSKNAQSDFKMDQKGEEMKKVIKVQNRMNDKDHDIAELYERNETDLKNLMARMDQLEKDKSVLQCNINLIESECRERMFDLISFINKEIDKNWFIRNIKVRLNQSNVKTGQLIVTDHNDNVLSLYELSGGQKSLMAVSVMFTAVSYYSLKSQSKIGDSISPSIKDLQNMDNILCLFDEIDAALDPSQTERIASFLKTRGCQTVVVSLKEGFWAQADRVYEVFREGMGAKAHRVK